MLSFKPTFSHSSFTFMKRLFSSSLSAMCIAGERGVRLSTGPARGAACTGQRGCHRLLDALCGVHGLPMAVSGDAPASRWRGTATPGLSGSSRVGLSQQPLLFPLERSVLQFLPLRTKPTDRRHLCTHTTLGRNHSHTADSDKQSSANTPRS